MLKLLKIVFSFCIIACSIPVWAVDLMTVNKETSDYIINIKYPEGFKDLLVNATIVSFIEETKQNFLRDIENDEDIPADAPGKTSLNITYSLPYSTKNALSVSFNISIYHRGAAHPSNTMAVLNFISGRQVNLSDLFRPEMDYLKPIAAFCNKQITEKNISDKKWIEEGTKPTSKNYQIWSFNSKGINIIFDTYQVAAYVYGPQTVTIPRGQISSLLKTEVVQSVWGN